MDYYMSFSAFVQFIIAFDFGLLYLEITKDTSVFTSIQKTVFDSFRENYFVKQLLQFSVNNKAARFGFMKKWAGVLAAMKTKVEAALDYERTCDYMAVLGVISGIYSLGWLLLVPLASNQQQGFEDLYMTMTMCAVVTDFLMVIKVIRRKEMTRTKAAIQSILVLMVSCFIGCLLYQYGLTINSPMRFNSFFMVSMMVAYAPICVYVCHVLFSALLRVLILISLLLLSFAYKVVALFC